MGTWFRRLAYLFRQSRHDAELREEIEAHRALRAAHLEREGLTAQAAESASRRAIGNILLAREDAREVWLGSWASWWQDVRYGLRAFRKHRAFTTAAVATLALGIGVNAGIFTVVNAVLFRDLPAPDAHELVSVSQTVQGVPDLLGQDLFSTSEYFAYRDRVQTLVGLAAYANAMGETTLGGEAPRKILGALVSCNFFAVLQQPPALGRGLVADDCEPDAALVVVLSHELWTSAFAADAGVVGRIVQLNRQRVTVAGVAAKGTYTGSSFLRGGYVAPLTAGRLLASGDGRYDNGKFLWLNVLGRQRREADLAQVRAELDVIASQIDRQQPGRATTLTVARARPAMPPQLRGRATGAAALVMAAFALPLLIACANVANLLLARGASRSPEFGIRVSLGASRARVVRQLVTESLLLSLAGGLIGSLLALWSFQSLVALAVPALLPPWFPLTLAVDVGPDVQVLAFAAVVTLVTGLLFGLAPALQVSKPDLHAVMRRESAGSGRGGGRLRAVLVGVQVALCMVLAIAAGLLLRGLQATYTIEPGFEYRNVALISLESAFDGYSADEADARRERLVAGLRALPAVEAVASADHKPLGDDSSPAALRLPGESEREVRFGEVTVVSQDYFSVLELPIVRGRAFTNSEVTTRRAGPRPAILSETTARNLWPGGEPIGRALWSAPAGGGLATETVQVVGVAADAQISALGRIDPYSVYVSGEGAALLIKRRAGSGPTISAISTAVRAIDPTLLLTVLPLEASLDWSRGISGTATTLFGGLGLLALVLASVGIFGVVSYAVAGRYREIGIRLALGASTRNVLGLVLRQTMRPVIVGAVIGIAAASAVSGVLSSVLFGVSPADPLGLGGAASLVIVVALIAGVLAARPATSADPTATLRYE